MAQAHHFLDEGRFLFLVEACEQRLGRIGDAALVHRAIVEKLGMAEAVRYVQLYHQGAGDYARERHEWLDEMSHDQIVNLMARAQKTNSRKRQRRKARKGGR